MSIDHQINLIHVVLNLQSSKMKNIKGIISNTTGCLNFGAFVGHDVVNFHRFHPKFDNQSSFLTVENSMKILFLGNLE
jgi:hypothetical protein